jgi:hypothetical protein
MGQPKIQIPDIPPGEKTPLVLHLVEINEQLIVVTQQQAEEIQLLKDEIARLKGHKPKPTIKPSKIGDASKDKNENDTSKKRPGSDKRSKTAEIIIHEIIPILPENIPPGSTHIESLPYTVIGIRILPYNVRYLLERWQTPDGNYIVGKLPLDVIGHFDAELKRYILYQHFQCHVTQPLLLEQLLELGVDISSGEINRILTEDKDIFHHEKDEILSAGLQVSSHVHVDDTGARHDGKNGYCTHIGNEFFAWFQSTNSKSRINFLEILRAGQKDYIINDDALEYMVNQGLAKSIVRLLKDNCRKQFEDKTEWEAQLKELQIVNHRHVKIATEGALIGSILCNGVPKSLVIVSDDAGQFNVFNHALCWIHAERLINKLIAPSEEKRKILEDVKGQIWDFYAELKEYKISPDETKRAQLQDRFREIFTQKTDFQMLNLALDRLYKNRNELLLVLDRPEIPLHNNLSENDIREYVKRRKISGGTRSDLGRQCRDTFISLKKTCRKLGVSFWKYLLDRISKRNEIPLLPELILDRVNSP